jgi:hypothetical protein
LIVREYVFENGATLEHLKWTWVAAKLSLGNDTFTGALKIKVERLPRNGTRNSIGVSSTRLISSEEYAAYAGIITAQIDAIK